MAGFIKGLTAADIPGTNNFVPLLDTPEPVSVTHSAFPLLVLCVCVCVFRCWCLTCVSMQDKLWDW